MSRYRRARVPGAAYFFTANLLDRRGDLLTRHNRPVARGGRVGHDPLSVLLIVPTLRVGMPPGMLRVPFTEFKEELMGRSRYVITEPDMPHFLTCTVLEWLPLFTRPALVDILLDCWRYQRAHQGLRLYGYVVLENHLHVVVQAPELDKRVSAFKSYTARRIIDYLEGHRAERALQRLRFSKRAHKVDRAYQLWQEGSHAELVYSNEVMLQKLDYIHLNPVKRGYVDEAQHWRYSSARNYAGQAGLIEVDRWDT